MHCFFPELISSKRYKHFFISVAKKDTSADESEAVVDPFNDDTTDKDKKASIVAIAGKDSAIAQAAMEQERINDIYFTSELKMSWKQQNISIIFHCNVLV